MSTDVVTAAAASRLWALVLEDLLWSTAGASFPLDPVLLVLTLFCLVLRVMLEITIHVTLLRGRVQAGKAPVIDGAGTVSPFPTLFCYCCCCLLGRDSVLHFVVSYSTCSDCFCYCRSACIAWVSWSFFGCCFCWVASCRSEPFCSTPFVLHLFYFSVLVVCCLLSYLLIYFFFQLFMVIVLAAMGFLPFLDEYSPSAARSPMEVVSWLLCITEIIGYLLAGSLSWSEASYFAWD